MNQTVLVGARIQKSSYRKLKQKADRLNVSISDLLKFSVEKVLEVSDKEILDYLRATKKLSKSERELLIDRLEKIMARIKEGKVGGVFYETKN